MMICPCCNNEYQQFGVYRGRTNAICPACGSLERHRLIWLYLKQHTNFFVANLNVLHCSPMPILFKKFAGLENLHYIPINVELGKFDIDVQSLPFTTDFFDIIIASHILEHVKDDKMALGEIFRTLKPGGYAILLVPISGKQTRIVQDGANEDITQDHLRIYGTDFKNKLEELGFIVTIIDYSYYDIKYGLALDDYIFVATKG